ncbi:uncharacterized protein LACBIDRAFT_302390 [Laccaria bicolor S238N-H82]|uniref:Predicted protein n=1 Tax=Laccaria bicolor (strain S238N-H82 / ATCC MYA-4686) TaxID=486041 RepID=B0E1G3_LACBS|nr:uncharacterized protein LACBIDRAFT_335130 [Laccaria bicolor S238N-H82]XP_001890940.1 uncharacterized protein LACBIDRAFT_302390 [Laccaria bicolor S238N-H82]EDQ98406.1 predicted protein [Laccaria bicolor S238N-H82]EDQ99302.1 predicted protein [Laccaria bicolor S238N-H82]|eukprot:XP_001890022.1 predicted protein [Laccaria bicolor S238N-H82]
MTHSLFVVTGSRTIGLDCVKSEVEAHGSKRVDECEGCVAVADLQMLFPPIDDNGPQGMRDHVTTTDEHKANGRPQTTMYYDDARATATDNNAPSMTTKDEHKANRRPWTTTTDHDVPRQCEGHCHGRQCTTNDHTQWTMVTMTR